MASGTNAMVRQIGNAFGIAFLGAILTHQMNTSIPANIRHSTFPRGLGYARNRIASHIGGGNNGTFGAPTVPPGVPHNPLITAIVARAAKAGFVQGLIDIFHVAAVLLAIGAIGAALLIRTADMHQTPRGYPAAQQPDHADAQAPAAEPKAV